jgi:polyphosphate kinase 2 (PPK2 family)
MSKLIDIQDFLVKEDSDVNLKKFSTDYDGKEITKEHATELLEKGREELSAFQDKLYAHNKYRILIILQAMDAAGKDSTVKHIMSGFNPMGVKVYSFKAPTAHELDHDYFWRHYIASKGRDRYS